MIKANELRFGNWVQTGGIQSVIDELGDTLCHLQGNMIPNRYEQIDPIPLIPEILSKFGFENADQGFEYGDGEQVYRLVTARKGYLFMILSGHQWCGAAYVESLHHLQNLLFCLLGYEIEVKL